MPTDRTQRRRTMPVGGRIGYLMGPDARPIRYAIWPATAPDPHGTVVVLNGRGEFIEKHFETYADLRARGYAVAALDWRGQGLSGRETAHHSKDHFTDFRLRRADLRLFLNEVVKAKLPAPYFAIAHSMGGHLLLHHLHDHPGDFERVALLAPMVNIDFSPLPSWLVKGLAALMRILHLDEAFLPRQGPYGVERTRYVSRQFLTSDPERFADEVEAIKRNPALASGGMTFGWLRGALESIDALLAPGYAEAIKTPILILQAGEDKVVDNKAIEAFAAHLPHARLIAIPGARHEILKENDHVRQIFWQEVMRFFKAPPRS